MLLFCNRFFKKKFYDVILKIMWLIFGFGVYVIVMYWDIFFFVNIFKIVYDSIRLFFKF